MRTILVTGATGAIGSALTRDLVTRRDAHLRLVVRAASPDHLEQRFRTLCGFWGVDRYAPAVFEHVEVLAGDVTLPQLGLGDADYRRLAGTTTHVIHGAGNVKLNRPVEEARRSAVDALDRVVSFVEACDAHGSFEKLEYVSTVGVAGDMAGTVPERALTESRGFRNSYEAAKAEAEDRLLERMARGLRATIHRPSMVVGDSRDGRVIQFQVFYHLCEFLSGRRTGGVIPQAGNTRLDIVPVDYVARAIEASSRRPDAAGRVLHLCAGPGDAPLVNDLATRVREFFRANGRHAPALWRVPPALMGVMAPVVGRLTAASAASLKSLPYFLAYLGTPQTFANSETQRFLSASGLQVPPIASYLDVVLSYYLSAGANGGALGARGVA